MKLLVLAVDVDSAAEAIATAEQIRDNDDRVVGWGFVDASRAGIEALEIGNQGPDWQQAEHDLANAAHRALVG